MYHLEHANYDWMELLNFYSVPFRAKFIPAKIWKDLDKYRNDSVGLGNYVKKWRTKLVWRTEKSKAQRYKTGVSIAGEYDIEKRQCCLIIFTDYFDKFPFTDTTWDGFKFRLITCLQHEIIHYMQYDRRDDQWSEYVVPYKKVPSKRKNDERQYLSEFDEIQAYAHCVLMDFKSRRPNIEVETLLNRCKTHRDSRTLHYFLKTFDYDFKNNAAIPKLMQQIVKWNRKYERITRRQRRPK
jgi:hypothetical protein